jgi:UPF0755 protein
MSDWYSELPKAGESYPVRKRRKRRGARGWAVRIVVVAGFAAFMFGVYTVATRTNDWLQAKAAETTTTTVASTVKITISPGMSPAQIGQMLEDKGVIPSASAFVELVASRKSADKLKPGSYTLATKSQPIDIVAKLETGQGSTTFMVTLREGLAAQEIQTQLVKAGTLKDASTYNDLVKQPDKFALPQIGGSTQKVNTLEGLLWPDTYNLMAGDGPTQLIGAQLQAFNKKTAALDWTKVDTLPVQLSPYQVLIVASLVEREAVTANDRAAVAAVVYNRLKKKMRLDLDVTVRYALNKWTGDLTAKDLQVDSPYNTRVLTGLPPAPICNPGLTSINAALAPAQVDYLYFLADASGKMSFTSSYSQFVKLKNSLKTTTTR